MKKKIVATLLVMLIAISLLLTSFAQNSSKKLTTLDKIKSTKVFKIGMDDTFPPMEYNDDNGNIVGFDVDMGKELAKRLGAKAQFISIDWNGIQTGLKAKKYDAIISCFSITEERKKSFNLTDPYLYIKQVVAVKAGDKSIKKPEDLKGKKIAVQANTTGDNAVKELKFINYEKDVTQYDRIIDAFHELELGRRNAIVIDSVVAYYYKRTNPKKFDVAKVELQKEPVGIAVRKEDKELYNAVQKALKDMKKDGTLAKISKKWFGEDITK
ncbi:ABC transporter substrate-binding protein [Caldicellulosiruptoraceae bacterium PP1]